MGAFIVGIDYQEAYQVETGLGILHYASKDAQALRVALEAQGYKIDDKDVLTNQKATGVVLRKRLEEFAKRFNSDPLDCPSKNQARGMARSDESGGCLSKIATRTRTAASSIGVLSSIAVILSL